MNNKDLKRKLIRRSGLNKYAIRFKLFRIKDIKILHETETGQLVSWIVGINWFNPLSYIAIFLNAVMMIVVEFFDAIKDFVAELEGSDLKEWIKK